MSIKKMFLIFGVVLSLLILGLIVVNTLTIRIKNELLILNDWRYQALKVSAEFRESSDLLTRNARQYIMTLLPIFKKRYQDVLDIRDGKKPRPDGVTIPLRVLIEKLNLNEEEISKFRLSEDRSNELALKEVTAMNAVEGLFDDGTGSFSKKGKPDFEMAKNLMFGEGYFDSKTLIMEPIKEVEELIDNRSKTVFNKAQTRESLIVMTGLGVLVFFAFSLFFSFVIIRRKIISPLSAAKPVLESIGKGNFEARWHVGQTDEIGELSSTLNRMIENIQIRTAELSKSEFRSKTILNTTNEGFWVIDNDRNTTEVNPEMCRILARQAQEIIGKNIFDFVDEDNKKIWREQVKLREKGVKSVYEISLQRPDSSLVPCLFNATPLLDEKGDKTGSFAMVTDITERKEKERIALLGSEIGEILVSSNSLRAKLQRCTGAFVSHLGAAFTRIWTVDSKENMLNLQASAGLHTHIDGSRALVEIGKKKIGVIAKEGKPYINKNLYENSLLDDKNWARENGLVSFYGYPMLVEGRVVGVLALFFRTFLSENILGPLPSIANGIAIAIERERAEQALQREEKKFRGLLDSAPDAMVIVDNDGEIKLVNKQTETLFGYTREELAGQEIEILVAEFIKKKHKKLRTDFMRETDVRDMHVNREFLARRKDGSEFPVDISLSPIETESGVWISAAVRDITARKEAEKRLRLTQFVVDNASDTIFWIEPDSARLIYVNENACRKLGYSREELLSKGIPDFDPEFPIETWQEFSGKLKNGEIQLFESKHKNSAGIIFPVEVTAKYIEFDKQGFIIAFVRDITERKKAEEALARINKLSDNALELTKAGFWQIDYSDPAYYYASDKAMKIFGEYPKDDMRYHLMEEWYSRIAAADKTIAEATGEKYQGALDGKYKRYDAVYPYKRPVDGKVVWIRAIGDIVRNSKGEAVYMYGVTQDITDIVLAEQALRENEERFELALRGGNLGLWDWNPVTGTLITNDIWEEMLGYESRTFGNTTEKWTNLLHPDDVKTAYATIEQHMKGEAELYKTEYRLKRKDGQWNWILDVGKIVSRDAAGNAERFIGIHMDINETKRLQQELEEAKILAEDANKAKSDFLARMSHEIRTPMNALIGLSHLALQTELTPKQQDYLTKIQFSSHNLLGIINDILDFSKIEAGKMDIEFIDFSLEDVLNNLSNLLTVKAQDKGVELLFAIDKNVPNYLIGDPLRLGQILINLGNNALKFTEKGGIVVRGKVAKEYNGKVELEFAVSDSGIGIPEDKISKLFQEFSQVDGSTTRKYGGTGLGLAICKRLTEMMGGKIWIESEQGKGSTFRFTVVFGKQSEQKEKSYKPTLDLQGMKVLVVDDNQDARDVFTSYLNGFSFNVTSVGSGSAAIHELERTSSLPGAAPYQLVMMDWSMPGMDGIETAVRIKDDYKIKQKPKIIMATAFGREEVIKSAEKAGLDSFLIKPVSQSLLFDTIMSVFGKEVQFTSQPGRQEADYTNKLSQIRGATILLVEDNEINQQVASELLEKESFVISIRNNGKEAIEAVNNWDYDLVLMDIQMPEMDGITATKEIRKNPTFKNLPIIAMTAHAMVGDHEKSIEAGMNDHVTKPIDPDQLFSTLVKWIKPGKRDFVPIESVPSGEEDVVIPDVIPGIDIETAMKRVAGNRTLFRKLLLKFRENNQTVVDDIKNALKKNDMELAQRLAHTVKGVSGNIAATDLYQKATELDAAIKGRKTADLESLIQSFSGSLDFVVRSIGALEESSVESILPEGKEISIDIPTVSSLLTKLKELLDEDMTEAENMLASLKKYFIAPEHKELLRKLSKQIEEYDSDSAAETINEIIKIINL